MTDLEITLAGGLALDDCDRAILLGIVGRALMENAELRSFMEFRGVKEVALAAPQELRAEPYTRTTLRFENGIWY